MCALAISFLWGGGLIDACTGAAECRVPARGLLYEVELLVGVAAQWMPAMEQWNNVFQLKGYSTMWEDLGGRLLASILQG